MIDLFLNSKFEDTLAEICLAWFQISITFCPILVRRVRIFLTFQAETGTLVINDTLQTDEWIEDTFKGDIPLLAVIPDVNYSGGKGYRKYKYYRHSYYESKTDGGNE